MLFTPAYAQDASGLLGSATSILPIVLIVGVFYFLLLRPQQQRAKEVKNMLAALKRGDRVVTGGGIIGVVQRVRENNEVEVEIAQNTRVVVLRETITAVVNPKPANDTTPAKT